MLLTPVFACSANRYPGRPGSHAADRAPASSCDRCISGAAGRKLHGKPWPVELATYADQFSQRQGEIQSWLESNAQSANLSQLTSSLKASDLTDILSAFLGAISSILTRRLCHPVRDYVCPGRRSGVHPAHAKGLRGGSLPAQERGLDGTDDDQLFRPAGDRQPGGCHSHGPDVSGLSGSRTQACGRCSPFS